MERIIELLVWFLLTSVACYELSTLIVFENGPAHVFARVRTSLGKKAATGELLWKDLADLFNCPFCMGFWLALILSSALALSRELPFSSLEFIVFFLSVAGAQSFMIDVGLGKRKNG